jgi:hypothetical protein
MLRAWAIVSRRHSSAARGIVRRFASTDAGRQLGSRRDQRHRFLFNERLARGQCNESPESHRGLGLRGAHALLSGSKGAAGSLSS